MDRRQWWAFFLAALLPVPAPAQTGARSAAGAAPADNGNWEMPGKNYASTRFSAMREITPSNVGQLKVAFTYSDGTNRGHEAPPLVVGNTMYLVTPFPNIVTALDLSKPGAPAKWSFKPKPLAASQGVACCDVVNRGLAYAGGRLFMNTLDGQTIALDAGSGKEIWRTRLGNIRRQLLQIQFLAAHGRNAELGELERML